MPQVVLEGSLHISSVSQQPSQLSLLQTQTPLPLHT